MGKVDYALSVQKLILASNPNHPDARALELALQISRRVTPQQKSEFPADLPATRFAPSPECEELLRNIAKTLNQVSMKNH